MLCVRLFLQIAKSQTRAFAITPEELETRRNPDELFVTRRKIFGGALKPGLCFVFFLLACSLVRLFVLAPQADILLMRLCLGVGKPLRAKPAGPTLVKYYPEIQVR